MLIGLAFDHLFGKRVARRLLADELFTSTIVCDDGDFLASGAFWAAHFGAVLGVHRRASLDSLAVARFHRLHFLAFAAGFLRRQVFANAFLALRRNARFDDTVFGDSHISNLLTVSAFGGFAFGAVAFRSLNADRLYALTAGNRPLLNLLAFLAFLVLRIDLFARNADLMKATAEIGSTLSRLAFGTIAGRHQVAFLPFLDGAAAAVVFAVARFVTLFLAFGRTLAHFLDAFEFYDSAFRDDSPLYPFAFAAFGDFRGIFARFAMHRSTAAFARDKLRRLAFGVADFLFNRRAIHRNAYALFQTAPCRSGVDFLARFAFFARAFGRRVDARHTFVRPTTASVFFLHQYRTFVAMHRIHHAVIRSFILTFELFATAIVDFHFHLTLAAFEGLDFRTNLPNTSDFDAFADVVAHEFLPLLILFADDVFVDRRTIAR